jgi:pyrroloquinoline quinone biosynthesis protein B
MGRLTAIVLGSAAGGAFPQWNCCCPVCELAWRGDPRVKPRTQASIAISSGDGCWTLLNASPDLGQQIRATPQLHPQKGLAQKGLAKDGLRGSPIDAVVLTGGEIDQITGLLSLRESTPFMLYATPSSHAAVAANAMFSAMEAMTRRAVNPGERFMLAGNIEASLFMVPGKLPLYLEGDAPEIGAETAANVGIELAHENKRLIFVPGAAAVSPSMRERFAKANVILFDGTLFTDDEMQRSGTGVKTGRRMGHMPIDGEGGALQTLDGLNARRIFVHINNTNPILVDGSSERAKVEAAGWHVAHDGMEIVL